MTREDGTARYGLLVAFNLSIVVFEDAGGSTVRINVAVGRF